ncbi:MAG: hypothetical protein H6R14_1062 [Proteobacteria bacterium]|nr:hypothetical protein [Pseudomonadota bacterium]
MTLTSRDLRKLLLPLLATVIMLVVAGLLAWGSQLDARKAEYERNTAMTAMNQIEQRLRLVRTEEQEIKDRAHLLQRLQESGITGEERRLDWMELLRDIQGELRIPGMNYEFGVQAALEKNDDQAYAWFSSPMRLQLKLLHEEDLLNFLSRIQKNASALVIVRNCKLSPTPRQGDARETMSQLSAECELQWLTARQTLPKK